MRDNPTRPTIFLELTQAEARAVTDLIERHDSDPHDRGLIAVVESKIHEAWTDEDIRSVLMEDAIVQYDYDPSQEDTDE